MHSDLGTRGGGGLALQGAIAGWPGEEAPCNPKDMDLGLGHLGGGAGTGMALSWPVPTGVTLEMVGCKPRHRDGGVLSCPQPQLVVEAA